jgi:hypothetical protein
MTAQARKIADSAKKTAASAKKTEELAEAASEPEAEKPKAAEKPARRHAKPEKEPEPTHRVLRQIVIKGEQREVDDLVHLDGLDAAELESLGYVLKT